MRQEDSCVNSASSLLLPIGVSSWWAANTLSWQRVRQSGPGWCQKNTLSQETQKEWPQDETKNIHCLWEWWSRDGGSKFKSLWECVVWISIGLQSHLGKKEKKDGAWWWSLESGTCWQCHTGRTAVKTKMGVTLVYIFPSQRNLSLLGPSCAKNHLP